MQAAVPNLQLKMKQTVFLHGSRLPIICINAEGFIEICHRNGAEPLYFKGDKAFIESNVNFCRFTIVLACAIIKE